MERLQTNARIHEQRGNSCGVLAPPSHHPVDRFRQNDHDDTEKSNVEGQKFDGGILSDDAEQGGHKSVPEVGESHLHADNRLRMAFAEVFGRSMNDRRINRRAPEAHQYESSDGDVMSPERYSHENARKE